MSNQWTQRVKRPAQKSINSGRSPLHAETMLKLFGSPRGGRLGDECQEVTNPALKACLETVNLGPFRATGCRIALLSLRKILIDIDHRDPVLHAMIGTDGMLCCRRVRGTKNTPSNHAFGLAIDLTIGGVSDERGDDKVLAGLLELYSTFHANGWWWGAGFFTEDAMHFEPSMELVIEWAKAGEFGTVIQGRAEKL